MAHADTREEGTYLDRRNAAQRRMEARRESIYRTRREWIIAEFIIGVVSCATAITGIAGGLVYDTLRETSNNMPWFLLFYGTGSAFVVLSFSESRCRNSRCSRSVLIRYAHARFGVHMLNMFAWGVAFLWLHFSGLDVSSVSYQALPLAIVNFWGMVEHAKALWLKPYQARTTSMVGAGVNHLRSMRG